MSDRPGAVTAGLLILACAGLARAQEPADLIVHNGTLHTLDDRVPEVEALAVREGRIVAIGTDAEILARYRGEATEVLDLERRTALPGLIDAHAHFANLGQLLRTVDLFGTASEAEGVERVREAVTVAEPGAWILGRGWDQNDWPVKEFPTRHSLDAVAPDHPVFLRRVDGHAAWANSRALAAAGIDATTPDPPGGRILEAPDGEPTGVLVDNAMAPFTDLVRPDAGELEARLRAAEAHVLALGLTGFHDMHMDRATIAILAARDRAGELAPRVVAYLDADEPGMLDWWAEEGASSVPGSLRLRVVGVKLRADGALGSRGAALLEPYTDDPGHAGLVVTPPDELAALARRAMELGLQPAIHAIGDRGNRVALDAIEAGLAATGYDGLRPRVEHAQILAPADIPRFAALDVIASVQPIHATSDMPWAEDRVGAERIEGAYAWRRLVDAGARLACGSDFPVERADPFHGLYAAVTRRDQEGRPPGGWRPAERMGRAEALRCFTLDAAAAVGMEDEIGSLTPGKRADFVVVDRDPMTIPESEIWKTRVVRTVIDGRTVFAAAEAAR